jgi:hypothetical protein
LLHWKNNRYCIFWECVCSLRYSAYNAYAPYCLLWSIQLYIIFPYYIIKVEVSREKCYWTKKVFWFSLETLSETFLTVRRIGRDLIKMFIGLYVKYPLLLWDFNETEFTWQVFEKPPLSNFIEILQWKRRSFMRTDGRQNA